MNALRCNVYSPIALSMMEEIIAINPITIGRPSGTAKATVADVQAALRLLTEAWPADERGPRHRDAIETCLKVIDGHRSSSEVRRSLIEAAAEAHLVTF